jgi:amino acid transporter
VLGINFGDTKHVLAETWLLFFIILALYTLVNIFADRILALMNNVSVGWHILGVAVVIALLVFVHLGAQLTLYAAEINVVVSRRLWPRSLFGPPAEPADQQALTALAKVEERHPVEQVEVEFRTGGPAPRDG